MSGLFDQFDEQELLAFVEGELDAASSNRLVARLEGHPETRTALLEMRRERAVLSEIADPELARDFVAELEPMLSRAMLVEPTTAVAGQYRRRHQRANRSTPWARYAAAAAIILGVGGGIWAMNTGSVRSGFDQLMAMLSPAAEAPNDTPNPDGVVDPNSLANTPTIDFDPESGQVHHFGPGAVDLSLVASAVTSNPIQDDSANDVTSALAMIVRAEDVSRFELALQKLMPDIDSQVALVRNFASAEAQSSRPGPPTPVANPAAGLRGQSFDAVRNLQNVTLGGENRRLGRGQFIGRRELCPSQSRQTAHASRGASHSVGVSTARLSDLLGHLGNAKGLTVQFRMFSEDANQSIGSSLTWSDARRLAELRDIRAQFDLLRSAPAEARMVLPIFVEAKVEFER